MIRFLEKFFTLVGKSTYGRQYKPNHGQRLLYPYKGNIGLYMDKDCHNPIKGVQTYTWTKIVIPL
jgi:hypothetical protein